MRLLLSLLGLLFFASLAVPNHAFCQEADEIAPAALENDAAEEGAAAQSEDVPQSDELESGLDSSQSQEGSSDTGNANEPAEKEKSPAVPVILLVIGIVSVLGMIIVLKLNAFLALIISALIVSLGVGLVDGDDAGSRMSAVTKSFGDSAAGIGIVIAMAAIIGKCMLDSGAADRIVRSAVRITGEKKASFGLMISGFVLAIPVFFDTVFYLLVPLARSLHKRTNKNYLKYLMAIATGGAITHTLVPPTPGPLLVAAILGVDIGMMMLVGTLVAIPAAIVGLIFSVIADKVMPVEMRPLGAQEDKHQTLSEDKLPSLWVSMLPVVLPVVLIGAGTLATTMADSEDRAKFQVEDILNYERFAEMLASADSPSPAQRVIESSRLDDDQRALLQVSPVDDEAKERYVEAMNDVLLDDSFYDEKAFLGVPLTKVSKKSIAANQLRMKPVDRRRMNRSLMEDAYPNLIAKHEWDTPKRKLATRLSLWSNPNFALLLAALVAMMTLKIIRSLSWRSLGEDVEESLMSGGVIILITAAGGAFGAMLAATDINDAIKSFFEEKGGAGIGLLLLGWGIASILKIAAGSSTVAMIVGAGMMAAIIGDNKPDYHMVYVAAAVGTGSLFGSWMNDSGFWVFTKMGGLTESESLKSWTPLLMVLSIVGLLVTILLSGVMPMKTNL
ncbi:MAG: SLC13 family permease [Planctomycetota bacterium]